MGNEILRKKMKNMRGQTPYILAERAHQAEGTESAKSLRWRHVWYV